MSATDACGDETERRRELLKLKQLWVRHLLGRRVGSVADGTSSEKDAASLLRCACAQQAHPLRWCTASDRNSSEIYCHFLKMCVPVDVYNSIRLIAPGNERGLKLGLVGGHSSFIPPPNYMFEQCNCGSCNLEGA